MEELFDSNGFEPERLTLARERRGLNKAALAKAARINPRTIGDYEAGRTEPSREVLNRIARSVGFPEDFFFEPITKAMTPEGASFRALTRMTAAQAHAALAVGTLGTELYAWIEERFDLPEPDLPDLESRLFQPEAVAAMVRSAWNLGNAPIGNVVHLLERHGIRFVSLAEEWREVDAFSEWVDGTPYICLSTFKTAERSIFDAAHELGHLVLHRDHAKPRGREEEKQADEFASNFLMPRADIEAAALINPSLAELVEAKSRWRVSVAALNYRLNQLGYSSPWHYREMCIELGPFRRREPNSIPREQSQVLSKVFTAMRAEGATRPDIAKDLRITPDELDALTFGLTTTALDGDGESTVTDRPNLRLVT